jgi:hypothetical protein
MVDSGQGKCGGVSPSSAELQRGFCRHELITGGGSAFVMLKVDR